MAGRRAWVGGCSRGGKHAGGRLLSPSALPLEGESGGEKDTCKPTQVC